MGTLNLWRWRSGFNIHRGSEGTRSPEFEPRPTSKTCPGAGQHVDPGCPSSLPTLVTDFPNEETELSFTHQMAQASVLLHSKLFQQNSLEVCAWISECKYNSQTYYLII
jgi:hypothetical protein